MNEIVLKRVYDDPDGPSSADGVRVFVDRLWPRGESKAAFHYDIWAKDVAPSPELREWYHEDRIGRWTEFRKRYLAELQDNAAATGLISLLRGKPKITLLFSSKDVDHNNAVILAEYLKDNLKRK